MDNDLIYQMQIQNWAYEVAKKLPEEDNKNFRESIVIDSSRTMKRQTDPFYKTHRFKRRV